MLSEELGLKFVSRDRSQDELHLSAKKKDGSFLDQIQEQTEKICIEEVKKDGYALEFVKEQTEKICLAAVRQNGVALQYVKHQTEKICLAAVKRDVGAFCFVKEQTPELCLIAVKENGNALKYVRKQTREICLEAVKQEASALRFVRKQTPELCLIAVQQYGNNLCFVKEQTVEIILAAVKRNPLSVRYIDTNVLPIKDWDAEWFKWLDNVELRRQFIRERGKEIINHLDSLGLISENNEYCLVRFRYIRDQGDFQKALIFKCPSTNDIYFTEVSKEVKTIEEALTFLNNGLSKEELAYES